MSVTRSQLAQHLRGVDLLSLSMLELGAACQRLGQSGRGTREELVERVYHHIWRKEYDGKEGDKWVS